MAQSDKFNYDEAIKKLESFAEEIENISDIDLLAERIKEATSLVSRCKAKITEIEKDINDILPTNE
jgi:hypothetical protein